MNWICQCQIKDDLNFDQAGAFTSNFSSIS